MHAIDVRLSPRRRKIRSARVSLDRPDWYISPSIVA